MAWFENFDDLRQAKSQLNRFLPDNGNSFKNLHI